MMGAGEGMAKGGGDGGGGNPMLGGAGMGVGFAMANQMGQQISQAAPRSAEILEAEADVWVVRANAYTQAALAELMRTRGIDLANQSKASKLATIDNTNNNGLINGALTNR
jgi:hypothetical protein